MTMGFSLIDFIKANQFPTTQVPLGILVISDIRNIA
jgi:hypothetical protein